MNRTFSPFLIVVMALLIAVLGFGSAAAQTCQDAAGGPIPCPPTPPSATPLPSSTPLPTLSGPDADGDGFADTDDRCPAQSGIGAPGRGDCPDPDGDFITNDGDVCPDQPGTADNGGCPVGTIPGGPTSTPVPAAGPTVTPVPGTGTTTTDGVNPLRPSTTGTCQLSTYGTQNVNVRSAPDADSSIVGTLAPNTLYPVLAAVLTNSAIWYRVEAGWVAESAVVTGGSDCPSGRVAVYPAVYEISAEEYEQATGGIHPETECFELPDGVLFCQTVLVATANDDGTTEAQGGGIIVQCGGIAPNNFCVVIDLTWDIPDEPEEFFEPDAPPPVPEWVPTDEDGWPQYMCVDQILDLAAAGTGQTFTQFSPDGVTRFADVQVPWEPCTARAYIPRPDQAVDGRIPVDLVLIEVDDPGATTSEGYYRVVLKDLIVSSVQPSASVFDTVLFDLSGGACVPVTHGDFANCPQPGPGTPDPVPAELSAFFSTPDPAAVFDLIALPVTPEPGDPTADGYSCWQYPSSGTQVCECTGLASCGFMANVGACQGNDLYCNPDLDSCVCIIPGG